MAENMVVRLGPKNIRRDMADSGSPAMRKDTNIPAVISAPSSRPPFGIVLAVLAGAACLLTCIGWTLTEVQRHLSNIRNDQMRLQELTGAIRNLNEAMTMSAQMGAATGEAVWENRYKQHQKLLAESFHELALIAPDVYLREGGKEMDDVTDWSIAIERRAFDLARAGNTLKARKELSGEDYVGLKRKYAAGMDRIHAALGAYITESAGALYRGLWILVGISVGAVFVAGLVCVAIASRTHRRARAIAEVMTAAVRASEQEQRKLALVASKTDNSVLITDAQGNIEWTNDGFVRLTGFGLEDVRGTSPLAMFQCPGADKSQLRSVAQAFKDGKRMREEIVGFSKSGRKYWCMLDLEPIRNEQGELVQFFAIQRDITARKEADDRLKTYHADILEANQKLGEQARELARRTVELEEASAAAEAASTAKSQFLANMSHEIRTPLNGVVGALELLDRTNLDVRQSRYARMASVAGGTLLSLINDILDYSKLGAGKMELETIDINIAGLCSELNDMFVKRVEEKKVSLSCEVSPLLPRIVRGDPTRLRQVMLNLISNAIKFTSEGGVLVRATPESRDRNIAVIRFTVTDSGIGIPPERVDRLFKSFSQVDASTTRRYGGTGLGLAICKSVVDIMGGQIGVSSEPGIGSTFWCTVPFLVPEDQSAADRVSEKRLQDYRVLLLSDNEQERTTIAELLGGWKFRHQVAGTDEAGLALALGAHGGTSPFDLILLSAPTLGHSIELAHRLNSDSRADHSALLALIDLAEDSILDPKRLRSAGVSTWVRRPVTDSDLLDAIVAAVAACRKPTNAPPAVANTSTARSVLAGAFQTRILVAEDNDVNQTITTELLSDAGYLCFVAHNGRKAVEEVLSGRYDAVLMDCQMPEMDGFEASKEIRDAEGAGKVTMRKPDGTGKCHIPIIALTANALPPDRERCLSAGMDDYLTKPLNPDAMIAAIQRYCTAEPRVATKSAPVAAIGAPASTPSRTSEATQTSPAVAAQQISATDLPVLDLDDLRIRCRGKVTLMESILVKFATLSRGHLSECREAVDHGDTVRTVRASHTLKGGASNIGAKRLAATAFVLEEAAKQNDLEGMKIQAAQLASGLDELVLAISAATLALRAEMAAAQPASAASSGHVGTATASESAA